MAGVAQQRDVAVAPARQRIAIDQRPFVYGGAGRQHVLNLRMEFAKALRKFPTSPMADQDSTVKPGSGWLVTK